MEGKEPLYKENAEVFVYGLEEFRAEVVSSKWVRDTWVYIVRLYETGKHALYSEDSLKTNI